MTVKDALSRLEGDSIAELINDGSLSDVDLYIPEFSFDYTAPDCVNTLKDMGITTVFDPEMADLSPMAETADGTNLSVDTVIHKTHIELDREGTRAAASTVIGIVKNTALQEKLPLREVRLDRPFIFVISDFQTETPIFMGTVASIEG